MNLFLLFLLPVYCLKLTIIKKGLFDLPNGFQIIKEHDMILLETKKERIVVDLVPISLNKYDILKLILGKNIQAKIRIRKIPQNILQNDIYSFLCSPMSKDITNNKVDSWILKLFLYRIKDWYEFKQNNYTLNIYKRNCKHYRFFVEENYKFYFSSK
jgi:hypothetical protein